MADLSIPARPEIFVVGDTAAVADSDGKPVPGIAPAAKQMGRYVAEVLAARATGKAIPGRSAINITATSPPSAARLRL
jgi:NADH dehydrogenase